MPNGRSYWGDVPGIDWDVPEPPPPPEGDGGVATKPRPRRKPEPTKDPWEAFLESLKEGWQWWEKEEDYQDRMGLEAWREKARQWRTPYAPPSLEPPTPEQIAAEYYAEAEIEKQFQDWRYKGFEEQVRAWELAQYGYIKDPWTGEPRPAKPWETLPSKLPMPEPGVELPPDWEKWYEQVTTPELHPKGNIEHYAIPYAEEPGVTLPEDYHRKTDEEKAAWLNANAYETVYVDENGNIIDVSEVGRRALVDPDATIRQVWIMGDDEVVMDEFSAGEIGRREEIKPSEAALRRRGEVAEGGWLTGGALFSAREREGIKQTLESSIVKTVLASEWSYEDKLETLVDLYSQYTGKVASQRANAELRETVFASLSPEEQEAIRGREEYVPPKEKVPAEKPVDEAALSQALAQYGVNLTANYPFISPITEAHLMRIPSETLELMSRYLEGKGVSWRDFLEVSGSWYGGRGQERGRWAVPRQWG